MPILVKWDAEREVFVPARNYISQLRKLFEHGKQLWIEQIQMRSIPAHRKFFVEFSERWDSMPQHIVTRFMNDTHLRKFSLIKCGWVAGMTENVFDSPEAAAMGAMCAKTADPYSLVIINGCVVGVYRARSMRMTGDGSMSNKDFNEAARDVLAFLDELLEIGRNQVEEFPELEDIQAEALVRLGKAHREPLRIAYNGGENADATVRED